MNEIELDISDLLPNFSALGDPTTQEGISAIFVTFLLVVFVSFLIYALIKWWSANSKIKFLSGLINGLEQAELISKRRDLRQIAKGNALCYLHWREFDESLVEHKGRLHNTLDAAHFFNTHTLAQGLAENRLIAGVPGFLTAIGVTGTFLGLQLGLGSMEDTSTTEGIKTGITTLLGGASIAFMTSVWGVALSFFFNFIEKAFERNVRHNLSRLEAKIDTLYPRITAEYTLSQISENSAESHLILQTLAEKIGDKLQEAVGSMTESMREALENSLKNVLDPAIQSMVHNSNELQNQQAEGAQRALEGMISSFQQGFSQHGEDQRKALDEASATLSGSMKEVGDQMGLILNRFSDQEEESAKRNIEFKDMVKEQLGQISQYQADSASQFSGQVKSALAQFAEGATELEAQQELRNQKLHDNIEEMANQQNTVLQELSEKLVKQIAVSSSILEKEHELHKELNSVVRAVSEASNDMRGSASEMASASANIRGLGDDLHKTSSLLSDNVSTTIETASHITETLDKSYSNLEGLSRSMSEQQEKALKANEQLAEGSRLASEAFDKMKQHQLAYIKELKDQVADLGEQMQEALNDYAKKVSDQTEFRMGEWNKHTGEYTGQMVSAVNAIAGAVEEIELKAKSMAVE